MASISIPAATAAAASASTAAASSVALGSIATGAAAAGGLGSIALGSVSAALPALGAATAAATPWLGYASIASTLLGGATSALGAIQAGQAAKASGDYNAAVASSNAAQAKNNAQIASEAGNEQAAMQEQRTRALVGSELANAAASGLEVNSGSPVDVRVSSSELGQLDAYQIRSQATREAYGYNIASDNFRSQAAVDKAEGAASESAGYINAGNTFLGAAGSAGSNFAKYQLQGGFSV